MKNVLKKSFLFLLVMGIFLGGGIAEAAYHSILRFDGISNVKLLETTGVVPIDVDTTRAKVNFMPTPDNTTGDITIFLSRGIDNANYKIQFTANYSAQNGDMDPGHFVTFTPGSNLTALTPGTVSFVNRVASKDFSFLLSTSPSSSTITAVSNSSGPPINPQNVTTVKATVIVRNVDSWSGGSNSSYTLLKDSIYGTLGDVFSLKPVTAKLNVNPSTFRWDRDTIKVLARDSLSANGLTWRLKPGQLQYLQSVELELL
ncbi:MAG: hypothetical protein LBQ42_07995, partial [Synergistaceae bacterium]|nr:hypothetical protein [Synergistaceae bacterium]